jgi:hypothetical protein
LHWIIEYGVYEISADFETQIDNLLARKAFRRDAVRDAI